MNNTFNYRQITKSITVIGTYNSGKTVFAKELINQSFSYLDYFSLKEINDLIIPENIKKKTKLNIETKIINNIFFILKDGNKKIVIDGCLEYLNKSLKKELINYFNSNNIIVVNVTTNIEEVLYYDYLVVLDNLKIAMEGPTKSILKQEKILQKLGINLPFIAELSKQLGYYNLVDDIYISKEELVAKLWS